MGEDEPGFPPERIDPETVKHFSSWMVKGPPAERTKVFEEIADGDELEGAALASLCDLELSAVLEETTREKPSFEGWFSLDEITAHFEETSGDEHDTRALVGALVNLADEGLVVMQSEPSTYKGDYIGANLVFRVYWPNVLDFWDSALDRLFRPDGHVYLLSGGGLYKIGRAKDVESHIRQLTRQMPWPVDLEHAFPCEGTALAETVLHEMYAEYRSHGEWFDLPRDTVAYLLSIKRMRGAYIEFLEGSPADAGALVVEEEQPGTTEPKPGETHTYKHYEVEEGYAMQHSTWGNALPFTFAETALEAENRFWTEHPEAPAQRQNFRLVNAVRVRDTYIDYKTAGDPRHVYSLGEWERRKHVGIDMYD